jgi:undecaprenyl diphosphate synthase
LSNTSDISPQDLHVAIIMDGNGRWATAKSLARLKGHAKGADRVRDIVDAAMDMDISHQTLFAFSTENWKRSEGEVLGLMALFRRFIRSEAAKLFSRGVKVRFIGSRDRLDKSLISLMEGLEAQTADNDKLYLTIGLNYGGRDEIARTAKKLALMVKSGEIEPDDIDIDAFSAQLDTHGLPDPDLVIRTSGEYRTSNFLPWQSVYAEYVFEDTTWPDFDKHLFAKTLEEFKGRNRRFGAVSSK